MNTDNYKEYTTKISDKEKKRLQELLNGVDVIDKSKLENIKNKNIKNEYETNFYIPEKWNY